MLVEEELQRRTFLANINESSVVTLTDNERNLSRNPADLSAYVPSSFSTQGRPGDPLALTVVLIRKVMRTSFEVSEDKTSVMYDLLLRATPRVRRL